MGRGRDDDAAGGNIDPIFNWIIRSNVGKGLVSVIKQVLVTTFGFTKTGFVLVLQGSSQNLSTKTFCFGFFLSHEPKLLPKLASPIRDENSQNIAYRYKTYIRRNQKKGKKVSVVWTKLKIVLSNRPLFRGRSGLRFFVPAKCKSVRFRFISLHTRRWLALRLGGGGGTTFFGYNNLRQIPPDKSFCSGTMMVRKVSAPPASGFFYRAVQKY